MFDTALVASNPRREVRRKLAALPAVVTVHAMAVGFVMVGQLWAVQPVFDPAVDEPYVDVQLPSPPPAPPGPAEPRTGTEPQKTQVPEPTQIRDVPSEPAKAGPPEKPPGTGAVAGGDPDSKGGVVPGGFSENPAVSPPPPPQPEVPTTYTLAAVTTRPVPTYQPSPVYPEVARRAQVQGSVVIHAVVTEVGDVVDVRLVHGVTMGCSEAALAAVRSWRYRAATLHGTPVRVELEITVTFRLNGAA